MVIANKMRIIKRLVIVIGTVSFFPALFFVEGLLIGLFFPDVPRSIFYKYYWFMFPALFPGGILAASYYLIFFGRAK